MSEARSGGEELSAKQWRYWNTQAGPRWVADQKYLEWRMGRVNERLLAQAAPEAGERVLEIGCGTGSTTRLVAAAVGAGGQVVAVDISEPMLSAAHRSLDPDQFSQVRWQLGDAATLSFERQYFDLAISRFGVMFFPDPEAAFKNVFAALAPGGRLVFSCWAPLAENPHWLIPFEVALRHLGPPAPQPLRAPGPLSLSEPPYLEDLLGGAGFEEIAIQREAVAILASNPEIEADHAMKMGFAAKLMDEKEATDEVRQTIRREMVSAFIAHGRKELPATLFLVSAHRPR